MGAFLFDVASGAVAAKAATGIRGLARWGDDLADAGMAGFAEGAAEGVAELAPRFARTLDRALPDSAPVPRPGEALYRNLPETGAAGDSIGLALRTSKKPIVLGETMTRVTPVAKEIGAAIFSPTSKNPARWALNQRRWIHKQIRSGRQIYDIGSDRFKPKRNPYYAIERKELLSLKAGYHREFRRWVTVNVDGITKRFRLYEWVK